MHWHTALAVGTATARWATGSGTATQARTRRNLNLNAARPGGPEAAMIRKPYGLDDVSAALRRAIGEREATMAASRRQVRN